MSVQFNPIYTHVVACFDLHDALLARQVLCNQARLQVLAPIYLLVPKGFEILFNDLPSHVLNCRCWPFSSLDRLSWLQRRMLKKWFKPMLSKQLDGQILLFKPRYAEMLLAMCSSGWQVRTVQPEWLSSLPAAPRLQPCAKSLAAATYYYRTVTPTAYKRLYIIHGSNPLTDQRLEFFELACQQSFLIEKISLVRPIHTVTFVYNPINLLFVRQVCERFPNVFSGGLTELIGHMTYADEIFVKSMCITHLGGQMDKMMIRVCGDSI